MRSLAQALGRFALVVYALGIYNALNFFIRQIQRCFTNGVVRLRSPLALHPLNARLRSSDMDVFRQIYIQREYRELISTSKSEARWIVDCGANVGYSAAYFASQFPSATVIAIEPDPENYKILQQNAASYDGRIVPVAGGIWHSDGQLQLVRGDFGDGREWASQTKVATQESDANVQVFGIDTILARFDIDEIDILKIDIEGAETALFGENTSNWLSRVKEFVTELHGDECSRSFFQALKDSAHTYQYRSRGELTFAHRFSDSSGTAPDEKELQ